MSKWIEWVEPFEPEYGIDEVVYKRATKETIIRYQKEYQKRINPDKSYENNEDALHDFMVVHWAYEVKEIKGHR